MTKQLAGLLVIGVIVLVLGAAYMNRVAIQAAGLKVVEESERIAEEQKLDNWEVFWRKRMKELSDVIESQKDRIRTLRINAAMAGKRLERKNQALSQYNDVVKTFAEKIKAAGSGSVEAFGETYTSERAREQLRLYVAEVVRKEKEAAVIEREQNAKQGAASQMESALHQAETEYQNLAEKGQRMLEQRDLQQIKTMSVELGRAQRGEKNGELGSAVAKMNKLLASLQSDIDRAEASAGVALDGADGSDRPLTSLDEAVLKSHASETDAAIEARMEALLK